MSKSNYSRILLKLSGEQLAGSRESGIDVDFVETLADELKDVVATTGVQVVIVVGGGNFIRGAEVTGHGIKRVTGDHMGMLSGLINSIALTDVFEESGLATRCLSNIFADQVAENYSSRRADKHLSQNRVVIVAGGIGRPYFTHDTAAVNVALELGCDVVLKATKVDGVYDKDPARHDDAIKHHNLTHHQALVSDEINVMDNAAISLAMENHLPVIVFDLLGRGNIQKILQGEKIGTLIN